MIMGSCWNAWELRDGWKLIDQDIGWVETIALELAILWLVDAGFNNSSVVVHSDNTGVVGAYNNGWSCNLKRNKSLQHTTCTLANSGLTILPVYITSASNLVDAPSHGCFSSPSHRLSCSFTLPPPLKRWPISVPT